MVEIVKFLPNVSNYFPSNICDSRNKLNVQRTCFLRLPPHNYNIQNDRVSSINTKLWIDHCSHNSSHLLDASSVPYSLHRKVMYEELSRHQTTTVNFTRRSRNNSQQRQQQQQRMQLIMYSKVSEEQVIHPKHRSLVLILKDRMY